MVKYLRRAPLDVFINCRYVHQDVEKTWITKIGHKATPYHNFKTLPHALPHALPYIVSQFSIVWCLFATGYHALPSVF